MDEAADVVAYKINHLVLQCRGISKQWTFPLASKTNDFSQLSRREKIEEKNVNVSQLYGSDKKTIYRR